MKSWMFFCMMVAGATFAGGVPYSAKWSGTSLPLSDARISSIPFCRVWPGHQRDVAQTENAHFVRFDVMTTSSFILEGPGVGSRLRRMLPLSEARALAVPNDDTLCPPAGIQASGRRTDPRLRSRGHRCRAVPCNGILVRRTIGSCWRSGWGTCGCARSVRQAKRVPRSVFR